MDEYFTTQAVAQTFAVSHQTVKNWSEEFTDFLSPTANPGTGRKRTFTLDDLRVFALIHDFHKRGYTYADAKVALGAGQRGDVPDTSQSLPTIPPALLIQLRDEVADLRSQLQVAQSGWDKEKGKVELLQTQLTEKEQLIRQLYKDVAHLEADRPKEEKDR